MDDDEPLDGPILSGDAATIHAARTKLNEAIGNALILWQSVERALFNVFRRVSACPDERVVSAIFYSPMDFSEKLKTTHNAARFALKKYGVLDAWGDLRKRMINASEVRNALAHFHLVIVTNADATGITVLSRPTLLPNFSDVTEAFRDRKPALQDLDSTAINDHAAEFLNLAREIDAFAAKIPPPEAPP